MKKLFVLMLSFAALTASNIPQKFDDLSNLSNKLFLSVLEETVTVKSKANSDLPPGLSFFSADAKFDGEYLKFCELGNGLYGVIYPVYGLLKNEKAILYPPYWEFLWLYASQFNLPIWCIKFRKAHIAEKTLTKLGGKVFNNIDSFEKYLEITYPQEKLITEKPNSIESHVGILAYGGPRIPGNQLEEFKSRHPGILFVNDFPALYERRKDKIHKIFDDEFLKEFRPRWGIYPTRYSAALSEKIKNEIKSEFYIIKPLVGRQSKGIMLVPEEDLDQALKKILNTNKKTQKNHPNKNGKNFGWENYHFDHFIVEEFIQSKQIFKNNKPYEPTLRLGFIISQNHGKISVNVINAFWKCPLKSVTDNCEFIEKHVTQSLIGAKEPSPNTSFEDLKKIRAILNHMLPALYEKILTQQLT